MTKKPLAFTCALILMFHGCGSDDAWVGPLAFIIMLSLMGD